MSEHSPIDESILRLLESSRQAVEEETSARAQAVHEAAREQDLQLTIGGLLATHCTSLANALKARENFYVNEANWLQRRRLKQSGQMGRAIQFDRDGQERVLTRSEARLVRFAEKHIRMNRTTFHVTGLLPAAAELTEVGPLQQDWQVSVHRESRLTTFLRTVNLEQNKLVEITPVHQIGNFRDGISVTEQEKQLEEADYFFPLGIIMQADEKVRSSVPVKISRNW